MRLSGFCVSFNDTRLIVRQPGPNRIKDNVVFRQGMEREEYRSWRSFLVIKADGRCPSSTVLRHPVCKYWRLRSSRWHLGPHRYGSK